jgi:excisionase family DNA binding protein
MKPRRLRRGATRSKPARTPDRKPLYTARELAELIGVSPWTIYSWARKKTIPSLRATDRVLRFDADAVIAALEGGAR